MSIDSINTAASSVYGASQANTRSTHGVSVQSLAQSGFKIDDTINLSFEAKRFVASDLSEEQRAIFANWDARMEEGKLQGQYHKDKQKFMLERHDKFTAIHDQLMKDSGGILYGTAYNPDNLNKPITTTSGKIHPLADTIRAFLQKHTAELEQMTALHKEKFPTYDEWKAARA